MKGGYQILDLTNIDITLGSEAVTITDNQVLAELLTLRDYIEDDYDYSKPLNRKLKPILLRLRDEKENEEIEASLWANLSIIDDNLSFKIEGIINGKTITINAVFEKLQDDDGNDYYAIDEASLLYTDAVINLIESGEVENAKPIYFHPVRMLLSVYSGGVTYRINASLVILNNDETPLTYASLCKWVFDNDIKLVCDGVVINATDSELFACISYFSKYTDDTRITLISTRLTGETFQTSITPAEVISFEDNANKIN